MWSFWREFTGLTDSSLKAGYNPLPEPSPFLLRSSAGDFVTVRHTPVLPASTCSQVPNTFCRVLTSCLARSRMYERAGYLDFLMVMIEASRPPNLLLKCAFPPGS